MNETSDMEKEMRRTEIRTLIYWISVGVAFWAGVYACQGHL